MRPANTNGADRPPTNTSTPKKKRKANGATALCPPARDDTPPEAGPRTSLGAGLVRQDFARIDWATLLRRIYLEDVLACPCGGRRNVLADIHERDAIVAILTHLGLDPDPPAIARARDPTDDVA
jgi:hypothetical protein